MNFWQEKPDFWKNKTLDNQIYADQKAEVARDITDLIRIHKISRVLDVGGYEGILGTLLPKDVEYVNLDIHAGFDITKSWGSQGLRFKPKTLSLTSLVLICLPPKEVHKVIDKMRYFSDLMYWFEEFHPDLADGIMINGDYGGKWNYHLPMHLPVGSKISPALSGLAWVKATFANRL